MQPNAYQAPVTTDDTTTDAPAAGRRKGRRAAMWVVPVVLLAGLGGGAAYAYSALNGGGTQPDAVVPADAVAFIRVDANPSLAQKVSAVRFLGKLPHVDETLNGKHEDFRKNLWEQAQKSEPSLRSVDYDKDIAPWLGDRLAVAVLPSKAGADPAVEVAVQVKDDDLARSGINKILSTADGTRPDVTLRSGYALFTEKTQTAGVLTALDKGSLAKNASYTSDLKALGDDGVLSAWADLRALAKTTADSTGKSSLDALGQGTDLGRAIVALRFDPDYIELTGIQRGASGMAKLSPGSKSRIGQLPVNTIAALSLSNGNQIVGNAWKSFMDTRPSQDTLTMIDDLQQNLGIALPTDLQTLVGSNLTLAVPDQNFNDQDMPKMGLRSTTDARKADQIASRVLTSLGPDAPALPHLAKDGAFFLGTDRDYLEDLAAGGHLADSAPFKLAVPDAGNAQFALYADLQKLSKYYPSDLSADERRFLDSLRSVGVSSAVAPGGDTTFTMRIVGK